MSLKVAYKPNGRTGNNLFQYLTCKIIGYMFGHEYSVSCPEDFYKMDDEIFMKLLAEEQQTEELRTKNIWCDGFFQNSSFFVKWRARLLEDLEKSKDYLPDNNCGLRSIKDFMRTSHEYNFTNRDVVISLRLDDFYQAPRETSDIIPPDFYTSLLKTMDFDRLYIVVDKPRHSWEHAYLRHFDQWNPTIISGTLEHDASVMRSARRLIHSNSTLCWLSSFMSHKTERHIPNTHFYKMQQLGIINEETDKIYDVQPLTHKEVHSL